MDEADLQILHQLRKNAGRRLAEVCKDSGIPAAKIYGRFNELKKSHIKKQTVLLDFAKLGLVVRAYLAIKAESDELERLEGFLKEQVCINSLYRGRGNCDFIAECLFRSFLELHKFMEVVEKNFRVYDLKSYNVVEDIKKEDFLAKPEHLGFYWR